jgi:hypothetical protein
MGKGDRHLAVEVILVALKDRVRQNGEDDIEVSCGSAAGASFALS